MKGCCQSCDRPLRKGSVRRAFVLLGDGTIASGLVCQRCSLRAVALVVPPPVTVAPPCSLCHKEPSRVCGTCAERLGSHVRELLAANVAMKVTR